MDASSFFMQHQQQQQQQQQHSLLTPMTPSSSAPGTPTTPMSGGSATSSFFAPLGATPESSGLTASSLLVSTPLSASLLQLQPTGASIQQQQFNLMVQQQQLLQQQQQQQQQLQQQQQQHQLLDDGLDFTTDFLSGYGPMGGSAFGDITPASLSLMLTDSASSGGLSLSSLPSMTTPTAAATGGVSGATGIAPSFGGSLPTQQSLQWNQQLLQQQQQQQQQQLLQQQLQQQQQQLLQQQLLQQQLQHQQQQQLSMAPPLPASGDVGPPGSKRKRTQFEQNARAAPSGLNVSNDSMLMAAGGYMTPTSRGVIGGGDPLNPASAAMMSLLEQNTTAAHDASLNREDPEFEQKSQIATTKLLSVAAMLEQFNQQLPIIRAEQRQLHVPPSAEEVMQLDQKQKTMLLSTEHALADLESVLMHVLMSPQQLCKFQQLKQELEIARVILTLFQSELHYMVEPTDNQPKVASLFITKQPFPKSVKQGTKATGPSDEPLTVGLLVSPRADVTPVGPVRAELLFEDYNAKRGSVKIDNDSQPLDDTGHAVFADIKFPHGSRLKMVRVRFSVEVQYMRFDGSYERALVDSNFTHPFIVLTNENQWEQSAAILIKKAVFDATLEVPWEFYANHLQLHYLRASRQQLDAPKRPLSKNDITYIHEKKFMNRPTITQAMFEEFWAWFGKALHQIRHHKQYSVLWLSGYIYGFISKPDAERLLQYENSGTFLIRFSEQKPGKVALAYVKAKESMPAGFNVIKHFLHDRASGDQQSLADFLIKKDNLVWMLQVCREFHPMYAVETKVHKTAALEEFTTKTQGLQQADGYELECS